MRNIERREFGRGREGDQRSSSSPEFRQRGTTKEREKNAEMGLEAAEGEYSPKNIISEEGGTLLLM